MQGGAYTKLDVPGATASAANDINNAGVIVFGWVNSSGADEGAVYDPQTGQYTPINVPGAGPLGSFATSINNNGDITFVWYPGSAHNLQQGALRTHDGKWYKVENSKVVASYAYGINDNNTFVGGYLPLGSNFENGYIATF